MNVLLVSGGSLCVERMAEILDSMTFDEVIAIDGGLEKVAGLEKALKGRGFELTHIVGDFDTVKSDVLTAYKNRPEITIHAYKPEKDYTDTDIALRLAITLCQEKGDAHNGIVMIGATGTRLDHVLANIQMLKMAMDAGIEAVILDPNNRIRMIKGALTLTQTFGKYISIIPVSEKLTGVTLRGFKYPLDQRDVFLGESLCVSNEKYAKTAEIEIQEGVALLIESRD